MIPTITQLALLLPGNEWMENIGDENPFPPKLIVTMPNRDDESTVIAFYDNTNQPEDK